MSDPVSSSTSAKPSKCAPDALFALANDPHSALAKYYEKTNPNWAEILQKFLRSSMDEVRLKHARRFSQVTMEIYDVADADHFRQGLLRREAGQSMAYPAQRDHSAHTVNNWLLGWFF